MARRSRISDDNLLSARIAGTVSRLALPPLSAQQEDAAIAELRQLAGHRPDLLAKQAGLALCRGETYLDIARHRLQAHLCIKAGADESKIPEWTEIGRARLVQAAVVPYTGSMHRR